MRGRGPRTVALACATVLAAAVTAFAQFGQWGGIAEGPGVPVRTPPDDFSDGAFSVCKLMYTSVYREALGMGWATDYPYAGINLMTRVSELTKTPVSLDRRGNPNYWVVAATDPALSRCPVRDGRRRRHAGVLAGGSQGDARLPAQGRVSLG